MIFIPAFLFLLILSISPFFAFKFNSVLKLLSYSVFLTIFIKRKDSFLSFKNTAYFVFFAFFIHAIFSLLGHLDSFFLGDFDYTAISEIINNISKGKFFITSHYGKLADSNYLSHHFTPLLCLFIPFSFLSSIHLGYAYGLIFYMMLSILLIYKILSMLEIPENFKIYSLFILACNPFFYRLNFSYHFELFFLTLILLSYYFHIQKKYFWESTILLLSLLLKEDLAIYISIYLLFMFSFEKRKFYIVLVLISIFYYFIVRYKIQPLFGDSAREDWFESWRYLSPNPVQFLFQNPNIIFEKIFSKSEVILSFLLVFLLGFFYSKRVLFFILPILLVHFFSERIWYNSFNNYYCYTILPILSVSFLIGIQRMRKSIFSETILILNLGFVFFLFTLDQSIPNMKLEPKPIRQTKLLQALKLIEEHKSISASYDLGAFLSRENFLYPIKFTNLDKDYILLDLNSLSPFVNLTEILQSMHQKERDLEYMRIYTSESLFLWVKI